MLKNTLPYQIGVTRNGVLEILPKKYEHLDGVLIDARIMIDLKQVNLRVEVRQGSWKSARPLYIYDSENLI